MLGERFVHRLEAFSDVVIGFSLAQLGATLIVPPHATALTANPGWLLAFLWTFALVCLMWWSHNRIFRTSFVPTPLAIVLNFVLLATIVLLVYFAQVFARATTMNDLIVAARLYFGMLAINYLITACLYAITHGSRRAVTINAVSGAFQLAALLATVALGDNPAVPAILGISIPVGFLIGRFAGRAAATENAPA
jgi:uncharacterized membrane protein